MSKKRKAGNADQDAMALASSYSREQLEKMLVEAEEALGGMVEDGDNTADASSHSGEADSSDDDIVPALKGTEFDPRRRSPASALI